MKKITPLFILIALLLSSLLLSGCNTKNDELYPPTYAITGEWQYTMSELDQQDTVYDTGTITFTGTASEGTYVLRNFYEIEYSGTYVVSNIAFSLEGEDGLIVQGSFPEPGHLFGSWESDGTGGLWTAVRK